MSTTLQYSGHQERPGLLRPKEHRPWEMKEAIIQQSMTSVCRHVDGQVHVCHQAEDKAPSGGRASL